MPSLVVFYSVLPAVKPDELHHWLSQDLAIVAPEAFLVRVRQVRTPVPTLEIEVDTDLGIELELCIALNRRWREALEALGVLTDDLELEVGSPGVGQPLLLRRQYTKNIGRLVRITLAEGGQPVEGRLDDVSETGLVLQTFSKPPKPGMKPKPLPPTTVEWQRILQTVVQITV
jgi:ribosome maturation factor RimP